MAYNCSFIVNSIFSGKVYKLLTVGLVIIEVNIGPRVATYTI